MRPKARSEVFSSAIVYGEAQFGSAELGPQPAGGVCPQEKQHGSFGPLLVHSVRACGRCSSGAPKSGYELYSLIDVSVSSVTLMMASSESGRRKSLRCWSRALSVPISCTWLLTREMLP